MRVVLRPGEALLVGTGLVTVVRWAARPESWRASYEALSRLVLHGDVMPDGDDEAAESAGAGEEAEPKPAEPQSASPLKRRRVTRARGDTNGSHGRKPPNRGTRA